MRDPVTIDRLACMLGLTRDALDVLCALSQKYAVFQRPKPSGGVRTICAPVPALKVIQRKLLDHLLKFLPVSRFVHGGVRRRNHVGHARVHRRAVSAFIVDLKDAFTHGTPERVTYALLNQPYTPYAPETVAAIVALTTNPTLGLPQGSPTSNALFNLICGELDVCLALYAKQHEEEHGRSAMRYTRYVDELVFSSLEVIPTAVQEEILRIIACLDFRINERKTRRFHERHGAITVTGVNISGDEIHLSKRRIEALRCFLHCAQTDPTITRAMVEGAMSQVRHIYRRIPKRLEKPYDLARRVVNMRQRGA